MTDVEMITALLKELEMFRQRVQDWQQLFTDYARPCGALVEFLRKDCQVTSPLGLIEVADRLSLHFAQQHQEFRDRVQRTHQSKTEEPQGPRGTVEGFH